MVCIGFGLPLTRLKTVWGCFNTRYDYYFYGVTNYSARMFPRHVPTLCYAAPSRHGPLFLQLANPPVVPCIVKTSCEFVTHYLTPPPQPPRTSSEIDNQVGAAKNVRNDEASVRRRVERVRVKVAKKTTYCCERLPCRGLFAGDAQCRWDDAGAYTGVVTLVD